MGEVVKFPIPIVPVRAKSTMTVGDLRRAITGCPDDMPISLEISEPETGIDFAQAALRIANVEARCDEVDRLYLWGSCEEDLEEAEV